MCVACRHDSEHISCVASDTEQYFYFVDFVEPDIFFLSFTLLAQKHQKLSRRHRIKATCIASRHILIFWMRHLPRLQRLKRGLTDLLIEKHFLSHHPYRVHKKMRPA